MDFQTTLSGSFSFHGYAYGYSFYFFFPFPTIPTSTVQSAPLLSSPTTPNPIQSGPRIRLHQSITCSPIVCFDTTRVPEDGRGFRNAVYADIWDQVERGRCVYVRVWGLSM